VGIWQFCSITIASLFGLGYNHKNLAIICQVYSRLIDQFMDINFFDPSDVPLPPDEIHIRELRVEPLADRRRVRIFLELTPFQQKPNCEIKIISPSGHEDASLSIIEAIDYKMQFTVHMKSESREGDYKVLLEVYYFEEQDSTQDSGSDQEGMIHQLPERVNLVDQREVSFNFSASDHV
jgi:hypothetical protein